VTNSSLLLGHITRNLAKEADRVKSAILSGCGTNEPSWPGFAMTPPLPNEWNSLITELQNFAKLHFSSWNLQFRYEPTAIDLDNHCQGEPAMDATNIDKVHHFRRFCAQLAFILKSTYELRSKIDHEIDARKMQIESSMSP
jgi:hypothetical protein